MNPFKILWEALKTYYDELFYFLLLGAITLFACILILPGPVAIAGLWYMAHRAVRGHGLDWDTYWKGIKQYSLKTCIITLSILVVYLSLAYSLWFYGFSRALDFSESITTGILIVWGMLAVVWSGVAFYLEAFLIEQIEPNLRQALRNSFFLMLGYPLHTIVFLLFLALLGAISIPVPIFLLVWPGILAVLSFTALRTLLQNVATRQGKPSPFTSVEDESEHLTTRRF